MSDTGRRDWVDENTRQFLALDISHAGAIVAYRKDREAVTLPQRIREDIYVCPFIGFTSSNPMRTGCLLHPKGSPHPQIGLWDHPQNFSFYGEGICLAYDCLAKERRAYRADFFAWAESVSAFTYGRLASDHTLHRTLSNLPLRTTDLADFYSLVAKLYEQHGVVTTSFEDIEKVLPTDSEGLCHLLARRISPERPEPIIAQLLSSLSQNCKKSP